MDATEKPVDSCDEEETEAPELGGQASVESAVSAKTEEDSEVVP